jgi:hypothetical protein
MFIVVVPSDGNCGAYCLSAAALVMAKEEGSWPGAKEVRDILSNYVVQELKDPNTPCVEHYRHGSDERVKKFSHYKYCFDVNTVGENGYKKAQKEAIKYYSKYMRSDRAWLDEKTLNYSSQLLKRQAVLLKPTIFYSGEDKRGNRFMKLDDSGEHYYVEPSDTFCTEFNEYKCDEREIYICSINNNHYCLGMYFEELKW